MIENLPITWIQGNLITNIESPSTTHCKNNILVDYLARYMIQRVMSVYKFELPDEIDSRYFKYMLFVNGWIVLTNTPQYGPIAYYASLSGTDMYYRPKKATITLNDSDKGGSTFERTLIGPKPDAVILSLQENYSSIMDLIYFYAERLALLFEAFDVNIINSKLAYIFGTDKKAVAETFKKTYDNIASGQPAVVVDKDLFTEDARPLWQTFFNNLRANYIGGDLMLDINKVLRAFDTEIGIANANTDKRERVTTDEVNANNVEALSRVEMWRENMQACFDRAGALIEGWQGASVSLRVPDLEYFSEEVNTNGQYENDPNRSV